MTTRNRDDDRCAYVYEKAELMRCGRSREQHGIAGLSHGFIDPATPIHQTTSTATADPWKAVHRIKLKYEKLVDYLAGVLEGGSDGVGGDWSAEEAATAIRHEAGQWSRSQSPQPAPETGGEWRLSSAMVNDIMYRDHFAASGKKPVCIDTSEGDTGRTHYAAVIVCTGKEHAAQIVADHNQTRALVEVLTAMKLRAEFALSTPGFIRGRDELQNAVHVADAALAAASGNRMEEG